MKRIGFLICLMLATVAAHATVTSQTISVTYTCTGSTGPYAFTFSASAPAAITVAEGGGLLPTNAYTVTAVNNNLDNGGSVTLNSACTSGQLVITRVTPLTQTTVFTDNMPVPMKSFENGLDKLTEISQEQAIDLNALETLGCSPGNVLQSLNGPICVGLPVPSGGGAPQSQINVTAYGAKGDCVTDDQPAIQSALNVQGVSTPQITVYFPAPPGGCYLTSTLQMTGASMQGQAGAGFVGVPPAGVILKGKPSQDVLHIPDPTTVGSVAPKPGWAIQDMVIEPDASVDASASFPHRWPGKWDQTCSITSSSHTLTCTKMEFSCADIGQNILIKGAGAAGADLSTTVATVTPCWHNVASSGQPTVTLTAAASTTVSNHYGYITPAGIALNRNIGNCGIGADNYDGNAADWVITGGNSSWAPRLWNVTFASANSVGGVFNNVCGMYLGATWNPYLFDVKNLTIWNMDFGIVQGMPDTNPASAPGIGQDVQKWDHGIILATYPWISINDGELTWTDFQLRANNGPQILKYNANNEPGPTGWKIQNPEFESAGTGSYGYRIEGEGGAGSGVMQIEGTELSAGKTAYLMTSNGRYHNSGGSMVIGGSNNWFDNVGTDSTIVSNVGVDNIVDGSYGSTSSTMFPTTEMTQTLNRGRQAFGTWTTDFLRNGTDPYFSDHDLMIWPQDLTDIYGYNFKVVPDIDSIVSGSYAVIPAGGYDLSYFNNMYMLQRTNNNRIYAGGTTPNLPAAPVQVQFSAKCPVITTFTAKVNSIGGGVTTLSTLPITTCSTSYQTFTMPVADFTSHSGEAFDLSLSDGDVDIAWIVPRPIGGVTFTGVTVPGAPAGSYVKADGTGYGYGWLYGYTASITGTSLSATCDSGTTTVTGAIGGEPVIAVRADGTDIGGAFNVRASVTSANTVTVYICGTGTPPDGVYNVAVWAHPPPP